MTIAIGTDKSTRMARVFHVLWHGERIAHDAAARQALICGDIKAKRFFSMQSAQESLHAALFHAATAVLTPRMRSLQTPAVAALNAYRRHLDHDLAAGHLAASIVGLQIVLEGLGALTLSRMNLALSPHGPRFAPFKRLLEQHEDSHHAFGRRWLERQDIESLPRLAADARRYFELACSAIDGSEELFGYGVSTPQNYRSHLRAALPSALTRDWP